ncbi:MAG: response regulator [Vicinamibacteria bacterium]|nr:response regulator [Vicinamibacteria bacterium]
MPKRRILLVEDDADTRRGVQLRLQAWGYETLAAADSVAALAAVRSGRPDAILLDLGLPGGDGLVVLERLRAMGASASIPVIVLTARDPGHSRQRALDLGATAFLQKPVENDVLQAALRDCLPAEAAAAADPPRRPKVLLIEDDGDTRLGLGVRLRASGYEVATAADAATATMAVQREKPDVVLLDLGLPGGDGMTVLKRIKSNPNLDRTQVVVLTARAGQAVREEALAAGAAAFLQKPADNDELLGLLRSLCAS